jgi:CelD/BcsL family acetyltransferase involved in cellulose biosynthesis
MERLSSGSSGLAAPSPADSLRVELVQAPLTSDAWAAYEAATRSHACTRAFIEHFDRPARPELALVRSEPEGDPLAAFVFERDGAGSITMLDRYAAPPAAAFAAFVEAAFERYPDVARVRTELLDAFARPGPSGRPTLVLREEVELRVPLPERVEDYERSLETKFVRECRRYERRLARSAPGWVVETVEEKALPREWVADIVRLHRAHLAGKGIASAVDAHYEEGVFAVARRHGCATVLRDGDRIFAGVIHVRRGSEGIAWVLGVDDAYAAFSPGKLVMLAGIRHLVDHGAGVCRFLLGDALYKRQLGGRPVILASYLVLRSWRALRVEDAARVARKHTSLLARRAVGAADSVASRALNRPEPVLLVLRAVARAASRARPGPSGRPR